MKNNYNHYQTIYWVFTQLCNDKCDHCYNSSGPQGTRMSNEECLSIIGNLPDKIDKIILSGGEPLAERKQLYLILDALTAKYGKSQRINLQSNGDLMTGEILDTLIQKGVKSVNLASLDRYHKHEGARLNILKELFDSRGMVDVMPYRKAGQSILIQPEWITYSYFGANEEMWLGGNWARGRALDHDIWMKNPEHNFCAIQSGARNFLGGHTDVIQETSIQLWAINPCCPGTRQPMGDARKDKVVDILAKMKTSPIFQKLNDGEPYKMGESIGLSEEYAKERGKELKNICLWCDEFFAHHFDIKTLEAKTDEAKNIPTEPIPVKR
ncbi:MAG: radical SAM protein [Chitinophagaceae bacterium]